MSDKKEQKNVDRSRLKLLGALAAAGASGGCVTVKGGQILDTDKEDERLRKKAIRDQETSQYLIDRAERLGGEGGEGGGESH